ncbi:PLP-dependent aminotransferase family protein [Pelagibius litoralis]|uniref:PLP-dependent aminotransferase family protein n=1 Tax=Pelagibius litoralis TaxID=374515 RepID=A0A967EZV1_9PROT|nr:PLP-dependent aminotransferase family protein [Pelagibius litoralis]NIA70446.1 PLP-dependent aminotransferase family protein [Pelagibius litoralis]
METSWLPDLDLTRGPLYWRIQGALAEDIRSGRLAAGERLPTHRALADALGVTVNTVTKAFAEAERTGLIVSRVGRGTYVKGFPEEMQLDNGKAQDVIDLCQNIAVTDTLDPLLNRLLGALSRRGSLHGLLQNHPHPGIARHRNAGARWIKRRGIEAQPGQVLLCNGGQDGLMAIFLAIARPGGTILTEKLNYAGIRFVARCLNLNLRGVESDEQGIIPDALEAACKQENVSAILVTPTNHNPTNVFTPLERRKALVEIAGRAGTLLVEDDAFGHLTGNKVPTLTALAPDRCIYVCGLSKSMAGGLRVGYVLAPAALVSGLVNSLRTMYSVYPTLMAEIATSLIEEGQADEFVGWHRREARERNDLAREVLGLGNGPEGVSSYHLWLPLPEGRRAVDFVADLRAEGVLVAPPEKFTVDHQPAPNAVRLALGSVRDRERLKEGLRRVADCLSGRPHRWHNLRPD